jgi:hypothetical protein
VCVWIDRRRAKIFDLDDGPGEVIGIDAAHGCPGHVRIGELWLSRPYLAEVTDALAGAGEILILGPDGARILLAGWLIEERPQLARRIVASASCEDGADDEIRTQARRLLDTVGTTAA